MLYPPQVVNISESKHDALKKGCNQEKASEKKKGAEIMVPKISFYKDSSWAKLKLFSSK